MGHCVYRSPTNPIHDNIFHVSYVIITKINEGVVMTTEDITVMTQQTFGTDAGANYLQHLIKTFVDRPVYQPGMTLDQVAFREGQRDFVRQITQEVYNES